MTLRKSSRILRLICGLLAGGIFLIEVQFMYNTVLISALQKSDSVIHIYAFFFKILFSIMVYHKILNIVLCATQ